MKVVYLADPKAVGMAVETVETKVAKMVCSMVGLTVVYLGMK
jgi:hypothetical protein